MRIWYNLGIFLYGLSLRIAAPFHPKAKLWLAGRRGWRDALALASPKLDRPIWVHCSSLGEFEQGRPLIEAIRAAHPEHKILLTFFSPSGYEIRKHYAQADHVCYLPLDTPRNARHFLQIVRPKLAVFVKYDLWLNLLDACERTSVPVVLISAIVRPESKFLRSALKQQYRRAFARMRWIFTQDAESVQLLSAFSGTKQISQAGDTRFDRVAELPQRFEPLPAIEAFVRGRTCIVAGSPWPKDEALLLPAIQQLRSLGICWIVAPHEIHPAHIDQHIAQSGGRMAKFSAAEGVGADTDVLWIDNVGMLSRLYHYAALAYIGGGFGAGIHNTQEAAVYGCPVLFGPNYAKFQEAVDMVQAGGAVSVSNAEELVGGIQRWLGDAPLLEATRAQNRVYMQAQAGATGRIMVKLGELGLV